ncbi:hypothetical protein STEG23_024600, partial [Scotinomys teguina]
FVYMVDYIDRFFVYKMSVQDLLAFSVFIKKSDVTLMAFFKGFIDFFKFLFAISSISLSEFFISSLKASIIFKKLFLREREEKKTLSQMERVQFKQHQNYRICEIHASCALLSL